MSATRRGPAESVADDGRSRHAALAQRPDALIGESATHHVTGLRASGPAALGGRNLLTMQRLAGNRAAAALLGRGVAAGSRALQRQATPGSVLEAPVSPEGAGPAPGVAESEGAGPGSDPAVVPAAADTATEAPGAAVDPATEAPDAAVDPATETPDVVSAPAPAAGVAHPGPVADAGQAVDAGPVTDVGAVEQPEPVESAAPSEFAITEERRIIDLAPDVDAGLAAEWGLPGSPERQAKVDEALDQANNFEAFAEGFAMGGAVAIASTVVQSGFARYLAAKGVSQAAKAAGPAGAIISGGLAVYAMTSEGYWDAKGEALAGWDRGEGDELWANRFHALAETLDILGNAADIVAGGAGIVATGALLIGLIPGAQAVLAAVPLATKVALLGGVAGLICGLLKAAAQRASRAYRERHLLQMELSDEESLRAQQVAITQTAEATYNFLGGMGAAGTVALGSRVGRPAQQPNPNAGGATVRPPGDPQVVARQRATPKQLEAIRAVDDAVASPGWTREPAASEPVQASRGDVAAAATKAEGAEGSRTKAASDLDAAGTRRTDAEAASRRAEDAHAESRARTAEADAAAREARARANAELDAPDSTFRRLSEAAEQQRQRADAYDARANQLEPQLRDAKQARSDTQTSRDAAQRRVDEATATEARALAQYRDMELGQMAKAIADDAGARRVAAQGEVNALDARLRDQDASVSRLEVDYRAQRALANQRRTESARLNGEAAAEVGAQRAKLEAAHAEWHQMREAEQVSATAGEAASREVKAASAAQGDAKSQARAREQEVADAHRQLDVAHAAEIAAGAAPQPGLAQRALGVAQEVVGPGGSAQTLLGSGSATTPTTPAAPAERGTEPGGPDAALDSAGGEIVIPVQTAPGAPPATSAQIAQLMMLALSHQTSAAQARAQRAEAQQEVSDRQSAAASLGEMGGNVNEGARVASDVGSGLEQKDRQRRDLEGKSEQIAEEVGTFGEKIGDITSFAGFVAKLLGYAELLTKPIMPTSVQNAGRSLAGTGQTISKSVGEVAAATQQRSAAAGPERAEQDGARAALEDSRAQTPGTQAAVQAGVEKVTEMAAGNEELLATASESVAANERAAAQAQGQGQAAAAQAQAGRAALEQWAEGARDERGAAIQLTQQSVIEEGFEVTEVVDG